MSDHYCMLVHVVQVAEGCRRLKLPQTAPSNGLPTFPLEPRTSCSSALSIAGKFILVLQRNPLLAVAAALATWPSGHVGTHSMTCDWVSSQEPSTDVTSCSTVHQHQCHPLWYYFHCLGQWADLQPLWISLFFWNVHGLSNVSASVANEKKKKLKINFAALLRTNTFSLEIFSLLQDIMPQLFPVPPGALPLLDPTPSCHNKWCRQRTLERFISKWLPKTKPHLYADEINIDMLPCSQHVLPNWCQHSCITHTR